MLLVSAPGSREERTERNSRFHALNQAIVQLVCYWFLQYSVLVAQLCSFLDSLAQPAPTTPILTACCGLVILNASP